MCTASHITASVRDPRIAPGRAHARPVGLGIDVAPCTLRERAAGIQLAVAALHHGLARHIAADARRVHVVEITTRRWRTRVRHLGIELEAVAVLQVHAIVGG